MRHLSFPRDTLYFIYLIFFRPITLTRYLHQIDIMLDENPSLFAIWRRSRQHPEFNLLIGLVIINLWVMPWLLTFPIAWLFMLVGFDVNWIYVIYGFAVCIALSVAYFVIFSMFNVNGIDITGGAAYGMGFQAGARVVLAITLGSIAGMLVSILYSYYAVMASGVKEYAEVIYFVFNVFLHSMVYCFAFGFSFVISYLRLPLYLIQVLIVWLMARRSGAWNKLSPVLWDETILLPVPGLDTQLLAFARQQSRPIGLEAIALVGASLGQGWAAERVLVELTLYDVENAHTLTAIGAISKNLLRLPFKERNDLKDFLFGIEEISLFSCAALENVEFYNRQEQLRQARKATKNLRDNFMYYANRRFAEQAALATASWDQIFEFALQALVHKEQIPNVYVVGPPLLEHSRVFKGRHGVFNKLRNVLITEAEQRPALLLFGARRVGKSSALKQLPIMLGLEVVPVSIDMEMLALTNDVATLFADMAAAIKIEAFSARHLNLPDLSQKSLFADPYNSFAAWFQSVEVALAGRWMLLCLDEYEYLEKMLMDGRVDERAFQLLRSLLQNNPHLTLLFSGAHTFEEMQPLWSHYLINARMLQIGHLDLQDARELVEHPIPNFPLRYSTGALEKILSTVGGQPFLLQAVCSDLVNILGEDSRFEANELDIERAFASVQRSASGYFLDLWRGPDTSDAQRAILSALAVARGAALTEETVRSLGTSADVRRLLEHDVIAKAEDGYRFKVELVRRWVESQL